MKSRILDISTLIAKGACAKQVARFRELFGELVTITEALVTRHAGEFDWDWAARNLLPAPLWAEYERQLAPLRVEYGCQWAPLWAEYERQYRRLDERQLAPLRAEYNRQRAQLWARLYVQGAS